MTTIITAEIQGCSMDVEYSEKGKDTKNIKILEITIGGQVLPDEITDFIEENYLEEILEFM